MKHFAEKTARDKDGMLILEISAMNTAISSHLERYIRKWVIDNELQLVETFCKSGFIDIPFHQSVISGGGHLAESYLIHPDKKYLHKLSLAFDLTCYGSKKITNEFNIIRATLTALSPQVTSYIKTSMSIASEQLADELKRESSNVLAKDDSDFDFNKWFEAWCIDCVTKRGHSQMKKYLIAKSKEYNGNTISQFNRQWSRETPNPAVYVNNKNNYQHLMLIWLTSCEGMQEGKMLSFCTTAVHNVVRHIGSHRSIWETVSVSNLVNIVAINTIAILGMHAAISVLQQHPAGKIYMPSSYKNIAHVFYNLNHPLSDNEGRKKSFYNLCIQDAERRSPDQLQLVKIKLLNLLTIVLKVMTGMHNFSFNPLRHALTTEHCLQNHEAQHCLLLVLIIFGNMGLMNCSDATLQMYRHQIYESIKHCAIPDIQGAAHRFATSATIVGTFGAAKTLLTAFQDNLECIDFFYNSRFRKIETVFKTAQLMKIFQRPLLQIVATSPRQLQPAKITESKLRPDAPEFVPSYLTPTVESAKLSLNTEAAEGDDLDEELSSELLKIQKQTSINEQDMPADVNHPMIDQDFCRICACGLKLVIPEDEISQSLETYSEHLLNESHLQNVENYKKFEEEEKNYYSLHEFHLADLLSRCEEICDNKSFLADLKPVIDEINSQLNQNKKDVQDIRQSAQWGQGIKLLQDVGGQLQALQGKAELAIDNTEKRKQKLEKTRKEQERKEQEEEEMQEGSVQEDNEEAIADAEPDYGEQDKQKRRKKKKKNRKKISSTY